MRTRLRRSFGVAPQGCSADDSRSFFILLPSEKSYFRKPLIPLILELISSFTGSSKASNLRS